MTDTLHYLIELRSRLLRCLLVVTIIFIALCFFSNNIYNLLTIPLLQYLPNPKALIATSITAPFIAPLKLTFVVSIFFAIPYVLYQSWTYIAPALYQHERRLLWPLLIMSTLLFYMGVLFAYFIVFPGMFKFFIHTAPASVEVRPDINQFLDLCLKLFFAFGCAFEVPIATLLLLWSGIVTVEQLKQKRPYIIVSAFIVGMLLAPPDVMSQTMLAIPLYLLFELGLFLARYLPSKTSQKEAF